MDISHLEMLALSHLPEEAIQIAQQTALDDSDIPIVFPQWLNEEEMRVFAQVGQVTLYHP